MPLKHGAILSNEAEVFSLSITNMVATGQEIVRGKKILQGQGKVREFHFESGKIYIFEKSQGKVKF